MSDVGNMALGRWQDLLSMAGIDRKLLDGKHHACPVCGGKDRFRFDDKKGRGTFFCTHCGAGDGVKLLLLFKKWEFPDVRKFIVGEAPKTKFRQPKAVRSSEETLRMCHRVWDAGHEPIPGDPVYKYFRMRGLEMRKIPASIRHIVEPMEKGGSPVHQMLAKLTTPSGELAQVQRTFLTEGGDFLSSLDPDQPKRKNMPGPIPDGASWKMARSNGVGGVAEGVDTALAAAKLYGMPVEAALSTSGLMKWQPPASCQEVIVFGDNDESFAGQSYAYSLGHKLFIENKQRDLNVSVAIPPRVGDWRDELVARTGQSV